MFKKCVHQKSSMWKIKITLGKKNYFFVFIKFYPHFIEGKMSGQNDFLFLIQSNKEEEEEEEHCH